VVRKVVVDDFDQELVLAAPNRFIRSRVERDYKDDFLRLWRVGNPSITGIRIVVREE
jgi:hypothetical protein